MFCRGGEPMVLLRAEPTWQMNRERRAGETNWTGLEAQEATGARVSAGDFRRTVGNFATGVTVVTTRDEEGNPKGFTANSFASLSLDPPLIIVCVDKRSDTHTAMQREGVAFAVNILAEHQRELSRRFASKGGVGKFAGVAYRQEKTGAPILDEVLAVVECTVLERFDGGDHTVVVGEVQNVAAGEEAKPLLYYRGSYNTLHD
jgi:flavin reductase (DIM6/NTAB) family NADH-FMN oxidoreductase RutF